MKDILNEFNAFLREKGFNEVECIDILNRLKAQLNEKKYGLIWEETNVLLDKPVSLKEIKEKEIKTTDRDKYNLLIEGDNLYSLRFLKDNYKNKISVIYIDPPYNTRNNDFIYKDKFNHSEWLAFMNIRLKLAYELLSDNGVIFISIDDNEQAQLKLLCDEIFGENNFVEMLIRKTAVSARVDAKFISREHEYLLIYSKDKKNLDFNKQILNVDNDCTYKYKDKYFKSRGKYKLNKLDRGSIKYSPSLDYDIIAPDGTVVKAGDGKKGWCWRWSKSKFQWGIDNDFIEFKNNKGKWSIYFKQYQYVDNKNNPLVRKIPYKSLLTEGFENEKGNKELKLLNLQNEFSYPKPMEFIKFLINLIPDKDIIVLDFFAGTGTTGHAVLELNKEDKGDRQFILCTNNENNICENITYQRLNRVINGYATPNGKDIDGINDNLKYYKIVFNDVKNKED